MTETFKRDNDGYPDKMITWEPTIYVPGIGIIKLTDEQVRELIKQNANGPTRSDR